ncbi:MAG: BNR-repeat neuraminidase N-terminal domain-containing protein, partial [Vicingaceae bacterium]|nr:BNR-repeat neuraminidase N-terminal domain-containing protein [Vicingaceae bacterium]
MKNLITLITLLIFINNAQAQLPGCANTINTFPYTEDFEVASTEWDHAVGGDNFNWTRDQNGTNTANTGPSTGSNGSTWYMYIETTGPSTGDYAYLLSDCFDFTTLATPEIRFDYHMYNSPNGSLDLQISTDGTTWNSIWILSGTQGDVWHTATVDLTAYTGLTVGFRFIGTRGTNGRCDFAVDDINISNQVAMTYTSSITTQTNTSTVQTCDTDPEIIGIEIVASGTLAALDITQITLQSNGTAPLTNVSNINVYTTGTSSTFATTILYGSSAPAGVGVSNNITGSQSLEEGTNYFWVVYDLAAGAVVANTLDVLCTAIIVDGSNLTPTVTDPAGSRTIIECEGNSPCVAFSTLAECGAKTTGSVPGFSDSGIANPGCGNYQGGDVWYELVIPASGEVDAEIKSLTAGVADLAMAIYTGATCSSLTLMGCDDNSGIGNMPKISLSGLTAGDDLYVRIWEPGNNQTGSFDLECTDGTSIYCLTDDAVVMNDSCYRLTDTIQPGSRKGCSWYKNTIDFDQDFDHTINIFVGINDVNGADGLTFTFHNDPLGNVVCGGSGRHMGADGIDNALSIEVDTYDNGNAADMADDHVAIFTSAGRHYSPIAGPVTATSPASNIEDGNYHTLRITWNATTHLFSVYFDGVFRLSVIDDFVTNVFGSNNVFWGSTAATANYRNEHWVCPPPALHLLPIELLSYSVACTGNTVQLDWITASELNNDYFTIERSVDAINFEAIATVDGSGNSSSIHNYSWSDDNPINGTVYYRLKQTDFNGAFEYH